MRLLRRPVRRPQEPSLEEHRAYVGGLWEEIGRLSRSNPAESHDHARFEYSCDELVSLARLHGWDARYIGEWNHPRGQVMMVFVAAQQEGD